MSAHYAEYAPRKKSKQRGGLSKLLKSNPNLSPVRITGTGRKMAATWWGQAWNKNLERYSDYANRLPRGRSYLRDGSVLDLQISTGKVTALVLGGSLYFVEIKIKPMKKADWDTIVKSCGNKIASMEVLTEGRFPEDLSELFTAKGSGLFPTPEELEFNCSCPDWAEMCKHVAAALYGVGARLDEDPTLFFTLRDIEFEKLLKKTVEHKMRELLKNADRKTSRAISDADAAELFQF
jgi:uncharacterized Zn finger protein